MKDVIFIKWGGSLITDKDKPFTPNLDNIRTLANQIKKLIDIKPDSNLILGHGSGSFGHAVGSKYKTRLGVKTRAEWIGFSEVWYAARELNTYVIEALHNEKIPAITFPPSTFMTSTHGQGKLFFQSTIDSAISENLVPVIHGDVIFDDHLGGTILSTEDIFVFLSNFYKPRKILLAGLEKYIWADYPHNTIPIKLITPDNFNIIKTKIQGSSSVDVTGGMLEKVRIMIELVKTYPETEISIFSGLLPNCLLNEVLNEPIGTLIKSE